MRLLLAITELGIGGAERVVLDLERRAQETGDAAAIAAAPGPLATGAAELIELPATGNSPLALLRTGARLTAIVRSFRPDILHAHNPRMCMLAAAAARLGSPRRRPVVLATNQGVPPDRAESAARVLRLADHVVCVSSKVAAEMAAHGVDEKHITTIPNGVSDSPAVEAGTGARLDAELGLGGAPVISAVGRLVPQKAHHRLIDAARTVHAEFPATRFLVVGDGPLRAELEARVRAAGLEDVVTLTGARSDARDIIARSDVVAFSSDWEGLSLAALEALAAGVPVVTTDVAGTAELVESGAAVAVPRSAEALAEALCGLLRDPARRRELSATALAAHRERFSTERMADRYFELYRRLLPAA